MAISLTTTRPLLVSTSEVNTSVIAKAVVESGSTFAVPICLDNLSTDAVNLTGLSFTSGSPTVTGTANQLANVKIGSVLITTNGTSDFASGTYVTAKPTSTTLTVSTNALQNGSNVSATADLTVDATVGILRVNVEPSGSNVKFTVSMATFDGTKATDSNGNGYDEVAYADGIATNIGTVTVNLDTFLTNFGVART